MGERVLLDTDYLIEYVKGNKLLPPADIYHISEITAYEFIRGTRDPKEAKRVLEEMFSIIWLDNEILELSASIWRDLRGEGEPLEDRDIIIGATAIARGIELLTLNAKHFRRLQKYGLKIRDE